MSRIGVFVCHCGHNIAGTVDVKRVAKELSEHPDIAFTSDYSYMCSQPGQQLIQQAIREHELDGVVVAACSPAMHELTFRKAVKDSGLNEYRLESANIREQVSWVHQQEPEAATIKALAVVRSIVRKVSTNESLVPIKLKLHRRTLIIGAGIAGIEAALNIADSGLPVVLVEKAEFPGGKMRELSGTYLNFSNSAGMLDALIKRVLSHPGIELILNTDIDQVSGYVGNFRVMLKPLDEKITPPEIQAGAIILASGYGRYDTSLLPEYGGGKISDVVDALSFEKMLKDGKPLVRPSDGKTVKEIVFVQCAGSRDPENGVAYCSKICCMYTAKQAVMYKERVPDGQAYVFYIDIRSAGKGYDEYVQTAMTDHHVLYLRGKVSKIFPDGAALMVWGADTLSDRSVQIAADLVVLATPIYPDPGATALGQKTHVSTDQYGWFNEAHIKLRPVETLTAGIFLAGTAQGPKDIPETVSQAGAAAGKVLQLFSDEELTHPPLVAEVTAELCAACGACIDACPYEARALHPLWNIATVQTTLCQSCGACVTACPNKACYVRNMRPDQIMAMIDEVHADV